MQISKQQIIKHNKKIAFILQNYENLKNVTQERLDILATHLNLSLIFSELKRAYFLLKNNKPIFHSKNTKAIFQYLCELMKEREYKQRLKNYKNDFQAREQYLRVEKQERLLKRHLGTEISLFDIKELI